VSTRAPRVLIVGGGFGGLYAASYLARSELADAGAEIMLLDRNNYFTFTPLLAEVVAGTLLPDHVTYPFRAMARRHGFRFVRGSLESLDPGRGVVGTAESELGFDYLVLAIGVAPRYHGIPGVREHSMPFTGVDHAMTIRDRLIDAFERAAHVRDAEERRRLLTFVVAGAGPAGVELASELWTLMREVLPPYFPGVSEARVILVNGGNRILVGWDEALARDGLGELRRRGIDVRLETRVVRADAESVTTVSPDGERRIATNHLVWTAGTGPAETTRGLGLPSNGGALSVLPTLQVDGCERIFAVGDVAGLESTHTGMPYPRVAPIAISQGVRAAGNIENHALGRPLEAYQAYHAGKIVALGGGVALVDILGLRVSGRPAWWIYRAAYLAKLVGTKNKVRVLAALAMRRMFEPDVSSRR
jgi:NADH:quinone reductase (non-electrogenic)